MQSKRRSEIAPRVSILSRHTQPLRVIIAQRLFLAYCTNFVIFQTATKKGILYAATKALYKKLTV